jgi:hypothetical protein
MSTFASQVFESPGYSTDIRLEPAELAVFIAEVERQWLARIGDAAPEVLPRFQEAGIAGYHAHAALIDHREMWPKPHRVLPPDSVAKIKSLGFLQRVRDELGPFRIAEMVWENRTQPGTEEIYWRLVRPDADDDVGPLHADTWFHETVADGAGQFSPDEVTVKLWIALRTEAGRNGLLVVPDSHRAGVPHTTVTRDGTAKPQIGELPAGLAPVLVPAESGTIVAFNEQLVHGGAVNRGSATRVSAEITLVFLRSELRRS